jgi:thiol-disulfide isomerase/thioredoxin
MRNILLLSQVLAITFSFAQVKDQKSTATKAQISSTVSVTFNELNSKLAGASDITCEAFIERADMAPLIIETPMKKEDGIWNCSFVLDDAKARLIVYRYVSGDKKDDNDGNPNMSIVLDKNGKPVEGSHLALGYFYLNGKLIDFKRSVDLKKARIEFDTEKKLFPKSWRSALALLELNLKEVSEDNDKTKIKNELGKIYDRNKENEDAESAIIDLFERMGDLNRADAIREEAITKNPKGKIAQLKQANALQKEKDPRKRIEMLEKLLSEFPEIGKDSRQSFSQNLARTYIQAKEYDKAATIISKIDKPNVNLYNSLAWPLIEKGEQLDKAIEWAKIGLDIIKNQTLSDKPSSMKKKDWDENNKYTLVMILDTYGTGLLKSGKTAEALSAFEEVYAKSEGSDPDMNANYVNAILKNQKYDKAVEIGLECIKRGKDSPAMIESMKEAYSLSKGSTQMFDSLSVNEKNRFEEILADANKIKIDEMRKKIRESRISQPSIDFTLKDLNGLPITLSQLKGKVIIVDFWATWCGPCKMSFPYLQKVFEKYQNNDDVKFLAVNSWERQKDYVDQLVNAKKFIEENKYTFPVILDEKSDDQFKVIGDYEVEGIPTKFIIDKKGDIAFKSIGFDGPSMEDELTQQIEMLLNE